jgi:tetratricopeptide (TPR) repeat protein
MNNQRRHELERNVLAEKLESGVGKYHGLVKPVVFGLVIGLIIFLGVQFFRGQSMKAASKDWTEFYFNRSGGDADSYANLSKEFNNTSAREWAQNAAAKGYLQSGVSALYTNRKEAEENIRKAIKEWEGLKDSRIPDLKNAANLGLASAYECLGDLDEAIKYYEVALDMPETTETQRERLKEQISLLKSSSSKEFYAWFNKLDPKPALEPAFSGDLSLPPQQPSISIDPNTLPDLSTTVPSNSAPLPTTVNPTETAPPTPNQPAPDTPPAPTVPSADTPTVPANEPAAVNPPEVKLPEPTSEPPTTEPPK